MFSTFETLPASGVLCSWVTLAPEIEYIDFLIHQRSTITKEGGDVTDQLLVENQRVKDHLTYAVCHHVIMS